MNAFYVWAIALLWFIVIMGGCLGWQLLKQNGRILLRLDELEKSLEELEFGEGSPTKASGNAPAAAQRDGENDDRVNRFASRSLVRSRIKRDGLKAGTSAPSFRLPRLLLWVCNRLNHCLKLW